MSQYALEGPITSSQSDLLNRSTHVKPIADFLSDSSTSGYVVSVEGAWGSGKTSVLNLLRQQLVDDGLDRSNIVLFSPWLVTDAGALAGEFLKQLSAALSISQIGKVVDGASKRIDIATKILKYARYLPIGGAREDLAEFAEALGAAKDALQATKAEPPDISNRKAAVVAALRELPSPIVVIIDDVDRLAPKDVYEIIRLVRAIGDFPNVRYVLAMDAGYVEKALERSGIPEHSSYLDKIFHHRFVIPPVFATDLRKLFMDRLRRVAESDKGLSTQWLPYERRLEEHLNSGLASLIGSMRDVNLLGNRVGLMKALFNEINFADVVALEALAIKVPSLYRHILQAPSAYTGAVDEDVRFDYCTSSTFADSENARTRALSSTPTELQEKALRVTESLFNSKRAHYNIGDLNANRAEEVFSGHLSAPSRLRIAISRIPPQDGITLTLMNRFLTDPGSRDDVISVILELRGQRRALWLLQGARTDPVLPEDALRHLGLLLDAPSSQHSKLAYNSSELEKAAFIRLRRAARASGDPLLARKFGVRLPYMDALDWMRDPKVALSSLDSKAHGAPDDIDALSDWRKAKPGEFLANWASHFDETPREQLSHLNRDLLRKIYEFRDAIDFEQSKVSTASGVILRDEMSNAVRWRIDRKGRRYFEVINQGAGKQFGEELAQQLNHPRLGRMQRAVLRALIADGPPILEHDCSVVPEEDLESAPEEPQHDYLHAY